MTETFDPNDKIALKLHGYVFSDAEDGATDSQSGCSDFDELEAYLKPPPQIIPPHKIVVIKPPEPPLARKRRSKKNVKHPTDKVKAISTRNFYQVLEQSSSEESEKDTEELSQEQSRPFQDKSEEIKGGENYFYKKDSSNAGRLEESIYDYDLSLLTPNLKEVDLENETELRCGLELEINRINTKERESKKNSKGPLRKIETSQILYRRNKNYNTNYDFHENKPFEFYEIEYYTVLWYVKSTKNESSSNLLHQNLDRPTSWDYISKNNVNRPNTLIEQEYEILIGLKEKSLESDCKKFVIKKSPMNSIINKLLKDFDYVEYLNVAAIIIGAYFWNKYNKYN